MTAFSSMPACRRACRAFSRLETLPDSPIPVAGRIEHWVVAERQGQVAARNMLGRDEAYSDVPFFWTQQYDLPIAYVGQAARWDAVEIEGALEGRDCVARYRKDGAVVAVATINRDRDSLEAEAAMEDALSASPPPPLPAYAGIAAL